MPCPVLMSERTAALLHRRGTLSRPRRPPPRPQIQTAGFRSNSSRWWQPRQLLRHAAGLPLADPTRAWRRSV